MTTMNAQRILLTLSIAVIVLVPDLSSAFAPSYANDLKRSLPASVFVRDRLRPCVNNSEPSRTENRMPSSFRKNTALFLQTENDNNLLSLLPSFASPLDRPILATLDLLSLLLFAAIGKASHAADGSIDVFGVLATAFPFVLAWFTTSPLTGAYSKDKSAVDDVIWGSFQQTAKNWILAIPLGCFLRGVIKGYSPPIPFVIVTMISTLVIIGGARVIFSVTEDFFSKVFK